MKVSQNRLLFLLFLIGQTNNMQPTLPNLGIEIAFPLSSLVYILYGKEYLGKQWGLTAMQGRAPWGHWQNNTIPLPMTHGYLATTDSIDFVLQPAVNSTLGFTHKSGSYASPFFYYSDVQRAYRNSLKHSGWTPINKHISRWSSKGPANCYTRGRPNLSTGKSFDDALNWLLFAANNRTGMQHIKYYGLKNAQGITISADSSFPVLFFYDTDYYFAQTGVKYFLPLHLVSPQDDIRMADPDFLNHGPAVKDYNIPIPGNILPWTHGYMPANIPALLTKQQTFVSDTNDPNKIDF